MVTQNLRRWRDRGAAAVEFALVVPVLILLIFGSIEFGLAVQARTMIGNAAREGVRVASLGGSVADVTASAKGALGPLSGTNPQVKFTCITSGSPSCDPNAPGKNSVATVVVTVDYTGITGMFPQLNTTLTANSVMRIEN
jgi:Flp pilus assembly protein TadG